MSKIADVYFDVAPWSVTENGFNPEYAQLAESIFSLGSEFMGIRGCFDEGYGGTELRGSYFNGIYERRSVVGAHYKGIIDSSEYMVNSVNWLYMRLFCKGELLDLHKSRFSGFTRSLDLKNGMLKRSFVWELEKGGKIALTFERMLSMSRSNLGAQRLTVEPVDFSGKLELTLGLDFSVEHRSMQKCVWECSDVVSENARLAITGTTGTTRQRVRSSCEWKVYGDVASSKDCSSGNLAARKLVLKLKKGQKAVVERLVVNVTGKDPDEPEQAFNMRCSDESAKLKTFDFGNIAKSNNIWWKDAWDRSDITIKGDEMNQQGIRYCIFQMLQTYHGAEDGNNIGAKGLTGEAYNGNSFWDTEVYCLPFYIFNDPKAAKSLLEFRHRTLDEAKKRAAALDCNGAFYPIATISGRECCDLWQHASLQLQASTAVVYGVWMYEKLTGDRSFTRTSGLPMMTEVCRMLVTRGAWTEDGERYGFYGVMGPDEFQLMVNNNCYTNYLARFSLDYTLESFKALEESDADAYGKMLAQLEVTKEEFEEWKRVSEKIYIPYSDETKLFEQHSGYFELPYIDVDEIPTEDFPLYSHWSYDRIYRNSMIKQPDVLMFMLMFNNNFTIEQLRANYEYYEPRCIHESSLSPSVHSILASQLGKFDEAYDFFGFATRLDLDNYNRNTEEGIHTTSIAGAWMNIIYGFGGMRTDGDILAFAPSVPKTWEGYSFRIVYMEKVIIVDVDRNKVSVCLTSEDSVEISIYGKKLVITDMPTEIELPEEYKG